MASIKVDGPFFALTLDLFDRLLNLNLTRNQYRIFLWFTTRDWAGDRWVDFDQSQVMADCQVSRSSYYETMAKFIECGLLCVRDRSSQFVNRLGSQHSKFQDTQSKNLDSPSKKPDALSEKPDVQHPNLPPLVGSGVAQTQSNHFNLSQTDSGPVGDRAPERENAFAFEDQTAVREETQPQEDLTNVQSGNLQDYLQSFKHQDFPRRAAVAVLERIAVEVPQFWQWVKDKGAKLPNPVRNNELWGAAQIRTGQMAVWFDEWLERQLESQAIAVESEPVAAVEAAPVTPLIRLQTWWNLKLFWRVKEAIATHPDWGIELTDSGPQLAF